MLLQAWVLPSGARTHTPEEGSPVLILAVYHMPLGSRISRDVEGGETVALAENDGIINPSRGES